MNRIVKWYLKRRLRKEIRRIRKEGHSMKLKKLFSAVQWANFATLVAQMVNQWGDIVPSMKANPYVLLAQGLIGALLPSVGGFAHQIAYGTPQDPDKK